MAMLRNNEDNDNTNLLGQHPPITIGGGGGGMLPPMEGPGGVPDPTGNATKPIEFNPGQFPSTNTPPTPRQPEVGFDDPKQSFLGGGSNTVSPPSVTQRQPFMSLQSPSPESLVGGRGGLTGHSGGQFGGGLGLGSGNSQQGTQDPSSLILSLMQLMGK